jgi:beta-phosphoglucomutase-like phosphatase (HAD superfamily)
MTGFAATTSSAIVATGERSAAPPSRPRLSVAPQRPFELDTVATRWESALDAAQRAVSAAGGRFGLPPAELERQRKELHNERRQAEELLARLAQETRVPVPWLSPIPVTRQMLGLNVGVAACLFDLEGVLTDASSLHASAWAEAFDAFLLHLSGTTGWHFRRFDPVGDYRAYVEGRPRLEGVRAFLESRGIRLPEGRPDDPPSRETAYGLAKRKEEALGIVLRRRGVSTLPAARRYLQACGYAGLGRAALSASTRTTSMLDAARLTPLIDVRVDAAVIRVEGLRSPPASDVVLAACRHLGVDPAETVSFTHSPAGVVAGLAAGVAVVGVGAAAEGQLLRDYGAERVVASVGDLLGSPANA